MTESEFSLTEEKIAMVERCIEHAQEHFEDPDSARYGEVCWWDDGDFRVEITHSFGDEQESYKHHGESVKFKASAGRILYSEYIMDMLGREDKAIEEYVIEEVDWDE